MNKIAFCTLVFLLGGLGTLLAQESVSISGRVVDPAGRPLEGVAVSVENFNDETIPECCGPAQIVKTAIDGTFSFDLPPAVWGVTADPRPPLNPTRTRVDTRSASVTGLQLQVEAQTYTYLPDDPPKAQRITVSEPDSSSFVTVSGAPGAVPGRSYVIIQTMQTGHVAFAEAATDGSFVVHPFAPPGTSLLIKADPAGYVRRYTLRELTYQGSGSTSPLSATILHVPPAAGARDPLTVAAAGLMEHQSYPLWRFAGKINANRLERSETLTVRGTLGLESSKIDSAGVMRVGVPLTLEMVARADGTTVLAEALFVSTIMTPTGLPIERRADRFVNGSFQDFPVYKTASGFAEATIDHAFTVPNDLPDGWYRPVMQFSFENVPVDPEGGESGRNLIVVDKLNQLPQNTVYLPLVRLGNPLPPRLSWNLLADTLHAGSAGARAIEDRRLTGLANRFATQTDAFVIPREHRSGKPLKYRLEPFAPTVSMGDRGISPSPPLIPFRFPSGSLSVAIQRPDGSLQRIGPLPFVQSRSRTHVTRNGVSIGEDAGFASDIYQLSTMDPAFEVEFAMDGLHRITLEGSIEDIWGNVWMGSGTYEVHVARPLVLEPAMLPGTGFEAGDAPAPAVRTIPPVPADIELRWSLLPGDGVTAPDEQTVRGRANRFGYFHPPSGGISRASPGEYRVDVTASHRDSQGRLWMGSMTWGGVIAPRDSPIEAHGKRGVEAQQEPRPAWFIHSQTNAPQIPGGHVFVPFHSGDVQWAQKSDAALTTASIQDRQGTTAEILWDRYADPKLRNDFAIGEIPLMSRTPRTDLGFIDPHIDPSQVDLWAYAYLSIQRPLVRVREIITETRAGTPSLYWRFGEHYGAQPAVGRHGDLPNDIKFQFAGVVLRGAAFAEPRYAIYGSLFVLVPDDDPLGGSRIFPPFQGNGGGPSGGPLFKLKGSEIDLFFHPTAVRAGTILTRNEIASFAGYSGPTLPSKVEIVVTSPSGLNRTIQGQANEIGWFHDPAQSFQVEEEGVWKAKVKITFDGTTSAGQVTAPFPTGDVLGSREGEFNFYVVRGDAKTPGVAVSTASTPAAAPTFVRPADGPITFTITPPPGLANAQLTYTTVMPGFILEEGMTDTLTYTYDAQKLAKDFPNLDLHDPDGFAGADTITISFLVTGNDDSGVRRHFARQIVIQGEELQMPEQQAQIRRRAVRK